MGALKPALAQSKVLTGCTSGVTAGKGVGAAGGVRIVEPRLGSSQIVHLVAGFGFDSPHTPQSQASLLAVGALRPALAQSKDLTGCATGATAVKDGGAVRRGVEMVSPSFGSSQTVHFIASCGLDNPQWLQFQVSLVTEGGLIPAAAKSKDLKGVGAAVGAGDVLEGRVPKMFEDGVVGAVIGLKPDELSLTGSDDVRFGLAGSSEDVFFGGKEKEGSEETWTTLAASRALTCSGVPENVVDPASGNLNVGRALISNARTWALTVSASEEFVVSRTVDSDSVSVSLGVVREFLKEELNPFETTCIEVGTTAETDGGWSSLESGGK